MPRLQLRALVPGDLEEVWEHVTACSATGRVNRRALVEKYGRLVAQDGDSYTFRDESENGVTWRCTFDRPNRRLMEDQDSRWSDRNDYFQTVSGGTLWTIAWEPKGGAFRSWAQWLGFQWRMKGRVHREIIQPVLNQFQAA